MKNVLVTGGFGFLGSHLVELLLQDPANAVHVVDDLSTSPIDLPYYLKGLAHPERLTYDLCRMSEYFARATIAEFTHIYHLASPVGPAGVLPHAGNMVRDVVCDGYTLIDYCIRRGARLLDVSTSEVYGGGQEGYCTEATPKIVPARTTVRLEYAIAKLAMETAIVNSCVTKALDAVIVRPFNVAGPRQSPRGGFVLPRFLQQADWGVPLTVFGAGTAIRAFTHVYDMVDGIALAMERGTKGEVYNIGNPANKTSIIDMAKRVIEVLGSKSDISLVDPKKIYGPLYEEANDKFPDDRKARTALGWIPQRSIDTVIQDAYDDYLAQKRAGVLKFELSA